MAKDIRGEIDLGLGELLGEANVVRASQLEASANPAITSSSASAPHSESSSTDRSNIDGAVFSDSSSTGAIEVSYRPRTRRRRYGLTLGVILGALIAAWIVYFPSIDDSGGEVAVPSPNTPVPMLALPLSLPLDTGVLGGLIADLDRGGQRVTNPPNVPSIQSPPPPVRPEVVVPVKQQSIDLKGPPEPAMVKEARETYRRNGGSEYAEGQEEGASPFGKEKLPPFGGRRGKIIQGGETYRMLRRTMVFSEPDDRGAEIAELFTGDRVLAEEKIGQWLKIRSQKGREGYIPIKVAEPLSDYYQRVPWEAPAGSLSR